MDKVSKLKAPFPYAGGKSRIAPIIWQAFGNVSNYVEPFAGSLAVLLANPQIPKIETVNDLDCALTNFWRAVSKDPEHVIKYANEPVNEIDLHAKSRWLMKLVASEWKEKLEDDPDFFDAKAAGYYLYGMSASIGDNFLKTKGLSGIPILSSAGGGIHGLTYHIQEHINLLHNRLKRVRVVSGDWKRIVTPSVTYNNVGLGAKDITGIFMDAPYDLNNREKVYREDADIFKQVCQWAESNGNNSRLRIAVCGYESDYVFPETWKVYRWATQGGLAHLGDAQGKVNSRRETVWFSPHCLAIK